MKRAYGVDLSLRGRLAREPLAFQRDCTAGEPETAMTMALVA